MLKFFESIYKNHLSLYRDKRSLVDIFIYINCFILYMDKKQYKRFEEEQKKDLAKFEKENEGLIKQENLTKAVVDICHKHKYELMRCINCPTIKECIVTKPKLKKLLEQANEKATEMYEEEIAFDDTPENVLKAQNRRKIYYDNYVKTHVERYLGDIRCMYERKDIMGTLQRFVDANYDISDPRVYIIVNELISNILNSGRINKVFTEQGLLVTKSGQKGMYQTANPLIKNKVEFSKFIMEATEALDRILKSDEERRADNNFTSYLMKELKIRDKMKQKIKDSFEKNIIDAEIVNPDVINPE